MKHTWHNNRISQKLEEEFPRDFSICDIDGTVRYEYEEGNKLKCRLIIYESKNQFEKISKSQIKTLKKINNNIKWSSFDETSGIYIIKIIDIDNCLEWYDLDNKLIATTTFKELHGIFTNKFKRA